MKAARSPLFEAGGKRRRALRAFQRTICQKIPTTATKPVVKASVRTKGQPRAKTMACATPLGTFNDVEYLLQDKIRFIEKLLSRRHSQ